AAGDIVSLVEKDFFSTSPKERDRLIAPALDTFRRENADYVVLGCTHFTFLEENIRTLARGDFMPVDSREGVASQAARVLGEKGLLREEGEGSARFYTTRAREDDYYREIGKRYALDYRGEPA
ncbi:MAG: hypothetical protein JXA95_07990, partial [Spirochaetales bacterium]|nr:hypothetical protein [Spirochaetales bacterium]